MPRRINAPSDYWPQKVLVFASLQAAIGNQLAYEMGESHDKACGIVQAQCSHLLEFDVPTFYVSKELLAAAARTDLPTDLLLEALPFPFPTLVFMFPKGTICHRNEGECHYIVVSRVEQGQVFGLPLDEFKKAITMPRNAIIVSTYLPENNQYYTNIDVVSAETVKGAFQRASKVPFDMPGQHLFAFREIMASGDGDVIRRDTFSSFDAEFTERLWLLGITLILIMASGENLLETGARLKTVKSKKHSEQTLEYWSPNYLGRVYQATSETGDAEWRQRAQEPC
jgi:hypothetical protein